MNNKTNIVLAILIMIATIGIGTSTPNYLSAYNALNGKSSCAVCHVDELPELGIRNEYGSIFENKSNHVSDPISVLKDMPMAYTWARIPIPPACNEYLISYNVIYNGGSCETCHVGKPRMLNIYGSLFKDQLEYNPSNPDRALLIIGRSNTPNPPTYCWNNNGGYDLCTTTTPSIDCWENGGLCSTITPTVMVISSPTETLTSAPTDKMPPPPTSAPTLSIPPPTHDWNSPQYINDQVHREVFEYTIDYLLIINPSMFVHYNGSTISIENNNKHNITIKYMFDGVSPTSINIKDENIVMQINNTGLIEITCSNHVNEYVNIKIVEIPMLTATPTGGPTTTLTSLPIVIPPPPVPELSPLILTLAGLLGLFLLTRFGKK
jgi:hypothetical protein